ncbi:MAG TPA: ImmA/IrrE family metallo-endopeptidase [Terriglobia bacterium]|nr:ImmA/IrrE family metallo-endopeptidase [Terriglobia bacterium]
MTNANVNAARRAVKAACSLRVRNGYALDRPCDVYELIAKQDVTLQFIEVPSLEGMYLAEPEVTRICVCALRPSGRQRLTAAHELGHRVLGHGTQLDAALELRDSITESSEEESSADLFAHYLLMPPSAVQSGFRSRGYDPTKPTAEQVYIVSGWLGVGFTTLLHHMRLSLGIIGFPQHKQLKGTELKNLRANIIGIETTNDVWILDEHWNGRDLHMQLGDYVTGVTGEGTEGFLKATSAAGQAVFSADRVGMCTAKLNTSGGVKLKTSRRDYRGFYEFRYLEECD